MAYSSLHPSGVLHWVPEQLNIKAVTGACKLIDGCSLALCSATVSVVSAGIWHRNKVNSIAWLYQRAQPKDSIHNIAYIHYIFPLNMPLSFPCLHHALHRVHASPSRRTHWLAQAPYFLLSYHSPKPPQAALKSLLCNRSPLLLHSACTHASHGLKNAGLRYRLKTRFRRENDSNNKYYFNISILKLVY